MEIWQAITYTSTPEAYPRGAAGSSPAALLFNTGTSISTSISAWGTAAAAAAAAAGRGGGGGGEGETPFSSSTESEVTTVDAAFSFFAFVESFRYWSRNSSKGPIRSWNSSSFMAVIISTEEMVLLLFSLQKSFALTGKKQHIRSVSYDVPLV
jgi:hypothetical protein